MHSQKLAYLSVVNLLNKGRKICLRKEETYPLPYKPEENANSSKKLHSSVYCFYEQQKYLYYRNSDIKYD
jgi:hypothetical protein